MKFAKCFFVSRIEDLRILSNAYSEYKHGLAIADLS